MFQLKISFGRFYDPDIEDMTEKYEAVDKYEFAITDNSVHGKTYMTWTDLITSTTNGNMVFISYSDFVSFYYTIRGCRGRDRIVVGFTTTYAISAYHN